MFHHLRGCLGLRLVRGFVEEAKQKIIQILLSQSTYLFFRKLIKNQLLFSTTSINVFVDKTASFRPVIKKKQI